jgi:hypothetical protein
MPLIFFRKSLLLLKPPHPAPLSAQPRPTPPPSARGRRQAGHLVITHLSLCPSWTRESRLAPLGLCLGMRTTAKPHPYPYKMRRLSPRALPLPALCPSIEPPHEHQSTAGRCTICRLRCMSGEVISAGSITATSYTPAISPWSHDMTEHCHPWRTWAGQPLLVAGFRPHPVVSTISEPLHEGAFPSSTPYTAHRSPLMPRSPTIWPLGAWPLSSTSSIPVVSVHPLRRWAHLHDPLDLLYVLRNPPVPLGVSAAGDWTTWDPPCTTVWGRRRSYLLASRPLENHVI